MNFLREFEKESDYLAQKDNHQYPTVSFVDETNMVYFMNNSLYEFVDLGLSVKWATYNVGATKPEEYGLYFAWGETDGYTAEDVTNDVKQFSWGDYKYTSGACNGATDTTFRGGLTKYNTNSASGTVDNLTTLELVDDAVYSTDKTCRMPTKAELEELTTNTTSTWETLNGVNGMRFTSNTNGNSIFVPAAGFCGGGSVFGVGVYGGLWSSSLYESSPGGAWGLRFVSEIMDVALASVAAVSRFVLFFRIVSVRRYEIQKDYCVILQGIS